MFCRACTIVHSHSHMAISHVPTPTHLLRFLSLSFLPIFAHAAVRVGPVGSCLVLVLYCNQLVLPLSLPLRPAQEILVSGNQQFLFQSQKLGAPFQALLTLNFCHSSEDREEGRGRVCCSRNRTGGAAGWARTVRKANVCLAAPARGWCLFDRLAHVCLFILILHSRTSQFAQSTPRTGSATSRRKWQGASLCQ